MVVGCNGTYNDNYNSIVTLFIMIKLYRLVVSAEARGGPDGSLMVRSQLLQNRWLCSERHSFDCLMSACGLMNAGLDGPEPLFLYDGVAASGWPINDVQ